MTAVSMYRKCMKCSSTTTDLHESKCECGGYMCMMNQIYLPKVQREQTKVR